MECNRDEAIRAKEIAEKKMRNSDFEGARKIAQKALKLFPDLDNISNLLTVCDVHCSAQSKIYGSEKDLYGILQVERLADEATIKKQYRRLALVLHPDKNKFPGAEAAFKLIGEANMVLSDRGRRSLHDMRCQQFLRATVLKPPHSQGNQHPYIKTDYGVQNNIPRPSNFQFGSLNHHKPVQSEPLNGQQSFWTHCPSCKVKYEYYRDCVNRALRCQTCSNTFIAVDLGAQGASLGSHSGHSVTRGVNPGSNRSQPTLFKQKEAPKQGIFKADAQSTGGFSSSHFASQINSSRVVQFGPWTRTERTDVGLDLKAKMKQNEHMGTEFGQDGVAMQKADNAKPSGAEPLRNTNRKRGRKFEVESSESSDATNSTNCEEIGFEGIGGNTTAGQDCEVDSVRYSRRSSRQRQKVSYNENVSDNDGISSPSKRSRVSKASSYSEEKPQKEASDHAGHKVSNSTDIPASASLEKDIYEQRTRVHGERSFNYGNDEAEKNKVKGEEAVKPDAHLESNSDSDCSSDPEFFDCPDTEFCDFDRDKEEHCFAADQIWACYDTVDSMPRFYALLRKVFSPGFKLRITWLEAAPEEPREIDWANEGLPVACGKFKSGSTEETSDRLMLSHQICYDKGRGRSSFVIYPQKGETWALFKDWDIKWSSDPENHMKYKYDIVEVLSNFANGAGVSVTYLEKVKGFVSLFQKTNRTGFVARTMPSSELFKFSHRIPSYKMTGMEREGVPGGSFELDPASLPTDLSEYFFESEVKMEAKNMGVKGAEACPTSVEDKVDFTIGPEKLSTPKKNVNSEGKNDSNGLALKLRRSPRASNRTDLDQNLVHASPCPIQKKIPNGTKDGSSFETPSFQADDETCIPTNMSPHNFAKDHRTFSAFSSGGKKPDVFHDFKGDKSEGKFQVGQIWAFRKSKDENRGYAQIKKIESSPFRLHVALLEVCNNRKGAVPPIFCGLFKVCSGKTKVVPADLFSHLVEAEPDNKNRYNIYPGEREIWAVYTKDNANGRCSDLGNGDYDIVEVLENNEDCIKVSSLYRLPKFKSVFRACRSNRSTFRIMEIPQDELGRFSHRIPAFQLTSEAYGRLRGFWELDPASVPGL